MAAIAPLEIKNLTFSYKQPLLQNLNLRVETKEFVTIMGENGSGKTTLVDCLLGCTLPQSGDIRFWGRHHRDSDRAINNAKIGWVMAARETFLPWQTVQEILRAHQLHFANWNDNLCADLLEKFHLPPTKKFGHLSTGENSKLRLVKALSHEPELLILDELTANLSPESKNVVIEVLLDRFAQSESMSVLYVCHNLEEALRLSDRVLVLKNLSLHEKGAPQ